jgi:hypothetical protein
MNKKIQFSHPTNTQLINHSDNDTADMIELMLTLSRRRAGARATM